MYQLLTDRFARSNGDKTPCHDLRKYCGGTWKGILENLDYIQGMGFDAIWISPIVDNIPDGYHGYWARDWNRLNEHFGDETTLKELINECHRRDIWVMMDIVANHVGPVGLNYSAIKPFDSPSHYHEPCDIEETDFENNQWRMENCRLAGLPDLNQENPFVREYLLKWVKDVVKRYELDGLRIDTAPHTPREFWSEYTRSARVFTIGEVFNPRIDFLKSYIGPLDSVLNYPYFFAIRDFFRQSPSANLWLSYKQTEQGFGDELDFMPIFLNNHDNPRLKQNINGDLNRAALALSLVGRGIAIVYYGDEQEYSGGTDPHNREELWTKLDTSSANYHFIKTLNKFRKETKIWNTKYKQIMFDEHMYVVQRDFIIAAFTNTEGPQSREVSNVDMPNDTKLCNYLNHHDCVSVIDKKIFLNFGQSENVKLYLRTKSSAPVLSTALSHS